MQYSVRVWSGVELFSVQSPFRSAPNWIGTAQKESARKGKLKMESKGRENLEKEQATFKTKVPWQTQLTMACTGAVITFHSGDRVMKNFALLNNLRTKSTLLCWSKKVVNEQFFLVKMIYILASIKISFWNAYKIENLFRGFNGKM